MLADGRQAALFTFENHGGFDIDDRCGQDSKGEAEHSVPIQADGRFLVPGLPTDELQSEARCNPGLPSWRNIQVSEDSRC